MRKRTVPRGLPVAATALVAGAAGVGGTLGYQGLTAPDTSAVDAQAAAIVQDLGKDLDAGFYSAGGGTYGGPFTEGTLVARVEEHGGALLSVRSAGLNHTAEVMLGLEPPRGTTVDPDAYPVRCYRISFARGTHSVRRADVGCPATRTDGRPGSLAAQLGALLARQPDTASGYRATSSSGYDHTPEGVTRFLHDKRLVAAGDTVTGVAGEAAGADVYAAALRINGVCHYLRMSTDADLIPLWAAPADEQQGCDAGHAVTASALYGSDPAKEG
ncbi:hypothetical protein [Streptomyces sp. SID13726]|uniref:hypothetical protein n=1 Tax=Streptomyces sp. SID13726 TaxID=2706058 RepID=UPI0013B70453|nr:hypothetical protein [Streptomyces sp. SID13726]NEB00148.1 hypothetical protein [Streptomyces sp. SID13726]